MPDQICLAPQFSDAEFQEEFDRQGFAVKRLLTPSEAEALEGTLLALLSDCGIDIAGGNHRATPLFSSMFSEDPVFKQRVDRIVRAALSDKAATLLPDYEILFGSLLIKSAKGSAVQLHSDWTMQADLDRPTVTLWCALSDVTPERGPLAFVAGSHGLFRDIRMVDHAPSYSAGLSDLAAQIVSVPIRAGEAILFDTTILHCSSPNETDLPRLVIGVTLIPKERGGVLHFAQAGEDQSERVMLKMDDADYLTHLGEDMAVNMITGQKLGTFPIQQEPLTRSQVMTVIANADQIKSGARTMADVLNSNQLLERAARPVDRARYAPPPLRTVLRDAWMQAELEEIGHTSHQLISADEAAALLDEIKALRDFDHECAPREGEDSGEYLITSHDDDQQFKRRIHELAMSRLKQPAEAMFHNYRVVSAWPFIKLPGTGVVPFHRDWTLQADHEWPTINVWCPLMDVDHDNGVLQFVEGSYRLFDQVTFPSRPEAVLAGDDRMEPFKVIRPTKAGEAIVFDPSMYHGSAPNISGTTRIAIALTCIPEDRPSMIHDLSRDAPGMIDAIAMDTDDFIANEGMAFIDGDIAGRCIARYPLPEGRYSIEEVFSLVKHADAIKSGALSPEEAIMMESPQAALDQSVPRKTFYRRARSKLGRVVRGVGRRVKSAFGQPPGIQPVPAAVSEMTELAVPAPVPYDGRDFAQYPDSSAMWQPFGNERYDAALRKDGYTTLPFLSVAEVDELAAIIEDAEQQLDREDVHIGTRFQLSAFNNDSAYKERIFDASWAYLKDKVEALVPGYEPLVINVFDKPPSDAYDPVPIHQNPSFVEEPAHRSISLWIPFTAVNRDNGTVGVLPGSHGRFNVMRAGNMAHEDVFAEVQSQLEDEWFKPVELPKGGMLALDDSIIHWSYPNNSVARRKAIQLIMVPRKAQHIYYFYDDDCREPMMDLYEVDKNFFFGFNCKARPETLNKIGRVPYHYRQVTHGELEAIVRAG